MPKRSSSLNKLIHGTIFAVPLPDDTYLHGRVTLDLPGALKRRQLPVDSPLRSFAKRACLLEMYSVPTRATEFVPSPTLIDGAIVEMDSIGGEWPVVGHCPVDPRTVAFPESMIGHQHNGGETAFECGEMSVDLPEFTQDQLFDEINVLSTRHNSAGWYIECMHAMGRGTDLPPEDLKYEATLKTSDLRAVPYWRKKVYKHLPFSMSMSYYEKQKLLGHNLDRFYE